MDRVEIIHENFLNRVSARDLPQLASKTNLAGAALSPGDLVKLFSVQVISRHLDRIARQLRTQGQGYYTIGSSGHEGNAAIAWAFRPDDMAFLHYRDAAFQIARSYQVPGQSPVWDMLLSFVSSAEDPISGGRHKVLGSKALSIPPQTSTIASHLPKAVGAAFSIGLANILHPEHQAIPSDGVVLCSFGDASLNHSTAQGAINSAAWTAYKGSALPLVFVCEDNGIGISVKTPKGWVAASMSQKAGLKYFSCNGLDIVDTYAVAKKVENFVRTKRRPAFLHMSCVRLGGHAGADVEEGYLSKQEIEQAEANDPILYTARHLIDNNILDIGGILDIYLSTEASIRDQSQKAVACKKLETADEVAASLIPPKRMFKSARQPGDGERRRIYSDADWRVRTEPHHMAKLINFALTDLMLDYNNLVLAGEDIGRKGGVYGVTQKLQGRFGRMRVIDTLLDEQSILGLAIGMAHNGILTIPEIQFLAYVHNAEDQIRGEAATLPFFSKGQFTNPVVIRIPGLGYQRGFGGHFHNDNSLAVLRDIPGLIIACPSNGRDAVLMLRECVRLAQEEQRIVAFIEPIALYSVRDLHDPNDGLWMHKYPLPTDSTIPLGDIAIEGDGTDLAIITYGNGTYLSHQAARVLRRQHNISARIIDLRWLAPMPEQQIVSATEDCGNILIVDECRRTGSQSEALMTLMLEHGRVDAGRITASDCFIATGPAYDATLPSCDQIVEEALTLIKQ